MKQFFFLYDSCFLVSYLRNRCLILGHKDFFFSYVFFYKLIFVYSEWYGQRGSLWGWEEGVWRTAYGYTVVPDYPFSTQLPVHLCQKSTGHICLHLSLNSYLVPLIYLSILPLLCYLLYSKSWSSDNVSLLILFFFKVVLAILGPLHFHMNFRKNLSISTKWKAKKREKKSLLKFWLGLS